MSDRRALTSAARVLCALTLLAALTGCTAPSGPQVASAPPSAGPEPAVPPVRPAAETPLPAVAMESAPAAPPAPARECPPPVISTPPPLRCPEVKPVVCPRCPAAALKDKVVIGEIENVHIDPPGFVLPARIDSGAEGTSIHATDITPFERDGERWIRFNLHDPRTGKVATLERKKAGRVRVKKVDSTLDRRVVVIMTLTLGKISQPTEVSLTDRSNFEFPVLIGRNFLKDVAVVDVSQQRIAD